MLVKFILVLASQHIDSSMISQIGAQVMLLRNLDLDSCAMLANGCRGVVIGFRKTDVSFCKTTLLGLLQLSQAEIPGSEKLSPSALTKGRL